ncbi:MAG TPA: FAD-binding oxidoreductase [Candidatus Aminicenantes bacterium]|nr:FAD-binding oxidoreductase [Candidatus Aminicenantes bacterium]HRY65263.1 FAD-binding oxidoreductase [Candidatus Aminicenantes bacterium]HRZ72269.1 FAD-binding oxidoreductase [Candidatus Aminicenantes bacterium]
MTRPKDFDVIVIGAGSVGTPTAMSLAEDGLRVLVLDRLPSVGQGSNKRAIGGLRATHSDPAKIRLCLRALEIFATWRDRFGDDIEWYKGGYSYVAYRPEEERTLKDLLVVQKASGLNIDWLDAPGLLEVIPDLKREGLIGGTFSPDDGNASPLLAVHAFYRRARSLGACFRFNERVTGLVTAGGRVAGVRTDQGEYGAPVVVNAAGAWGAEIAALAGMDLPIRPDSHEGAVTEAVARFLGPMVVDIRPVAGSANYYFYQHATGQIIFCITPSPSIWGTDIRETSSFLPMVAGRMVDLIPRLRNLRVRRTWRGLYPMTPDGFPIVGWCRTLEGYLLAAGMCGQGFMLGPGVGELVARLVRGATTADDRETLTYLSPYRGFKGQEKLA